MALKPGPATPSPDALRAWLEGRGPCPWPGERETEALRRGAELLLTMPANELADLMADNPTDATTEDAIAFVEGSARSTMKPRAK